MRKLAVLTFLSLDGVMQAPGGKGEDPSRGFDLEGWAVPYFDEELGKEMGRQMGMPFDLLLGKKTYDIFAAYWPNQTGEDGAGINKATKYVVSTGQVDTSWEKTVHLRGDIIEEIQNIKSSEDGPMLQVHGSGELIQTLLKNDLIDEFWLKIFPVTLGKGKRLFDEGTLPAAYKVTESKVTPSGVVVATYERDGEVRTGTFA